MSERTSFALSATACLVLADGTYFYGQGFGKIGQAVGELCFNTSITGYQEIMTDPSYAGQIVTFTFPHIGNVGANPQDHEAPKPVAIGMVVRQMPTEASNWRATQSLAKWMQDFGCIGIAGVDTRRLTRHLRDHGMQKALLAHDPQGQFDVASLVAKARAWDGMEGTDLAKTVCTDSVYPWNQPRWQENVPTDRRKKVVAVDYGAKQNILCSLVSAGFDVVVVPGTASFDDIMVHKPDGVFLSNGPGDPAAMGDYAVPAIAQLIAKTQLPIFGICLGHQLLALALGAKTRKMSSGHHGANHPVKDLQTGKVVITSMNHGFAVDADTLPSGVVATHVSLFDGTNCGLRMVDRPVFSVQYHPEASPGPQDSLYLFDQFANAVQK